MLTGGFLAIEAHPHEALFVGGFKGIMFVENDRGALNTATCDSTAGSVGILVVAAERSNVGLWLKAVFLATT